MRSMEHDCDLSSLELLKKLGQEKKNLIAVGKLRSKKDKKVTTTGVPFSIPNHWVWARLRDISIIQEGPGIRKHQYTEEGVQFLTVTNILEGSVDLNKSQKYVSFEEYDTKYRHFELDRNDIVIACSGGSWGKSAVFDHDDKMILNTSTLRLRFFGDIGDNKYLYYLTKGRFFNKQIEAQLSGQQPNFGYSHYSVVQVPLPPKQEQKRIVAILDQAFADIEQARAKTEQNLKNARELFESYLQQVFSQRGEGWVETTLGDEIDILTGFAFKSKEYVEHADSTPLIRGDNIVQGKLRWDGVKLWANNKVDEYEKYLLKADDIVIAMDRTWVKAGMKFSKITAKDLPALLVQRVARLRCTDSIDPDYLYHLVGSKLFESYVLSIQTGLGVPHISGKQIQSFSFFRPNIDQQKVIVSTMNKLASEVLRLNQIYQSKLESIDELKKSILKKTFSGELTKQQEGAAA